MMPPSRRFTRSCAALTPKYWLWPAGLLDPGVEDDEVVDDLQQPVLSSEQHEGLVERVLDAGEFRIDSARVAGSMSLISAAT